MASTLLLSIYAFSMHYGHKWWLLVIAEILLFSFYLTAFLLRPIRLQATDCCLNIRFLCYRKKIPYDRILNIKKATPETRQSFNRWSAWMYISYIGKDKNLLSFCNNKKNSFLVQTDKRHYLLSCNHSEELIKWLNDKKGYKQIKTI